MPSTLILGRQVAMENNDDISPLQGLIPLTLRGMGCTHSYATAPRWGFDASLLPALKGHLTKTKGQSLAKIKRLNNFQVIHTIGALDIKSLTPLLPALKGHHTKTKGQSLAKIKRLNNLQIIHTIGA